jgi:mercuric ion transport protein
MNTQNKTPRGLLAAGIIAAIVASLCCITPVLAVIAGVSGAASAFSWLEPARPFFIAATVLVLGVAWFQKLKPRKAEKIDCDCEEEKKPPFWHTKKFLAVVTVFAALMLAFPYYSGIFFQNNTAANTIIVQEGNIVKATLFIKGMTCTGCEHSVDHALKSKEGVLEASSSYKTGTAKVKFDKSKVTLKELEEVVEKVAGYEVTGSQVEVENKNEK